MIANRREFMKASLGNGLKLAGLGSLVSLTPIVRLRGMSQNLDEDGYQTSSESRKLGEDRAKEVLPLGSPAPRWLQDAGVYNGWYVPWSDSILENWLKDFPLIIGVPHQKTWIDRAHQLGIRVIPYISFYKSINIPMAQKLGWTFFNTDPSPFWSELDLSRHPEWLLYNHEGKVRRPFNAPDYPPEWEEVCTASPGFAEAALKGVQALLELGVDGLFIDNVHPTPHCYGPALGKHTHIDGLDNGEAFGKLLASVYALVKKRSSDNIVALNPGHVEPSYWPCADAMMFESYICTDRDGGYTCSKGWDPILQKAKTTQRAIDGGKVILTLSYFFGEAFYGVDQPKSQKPRVGPPNREDIFYAYACARLSGFIWTDYFSLPENDPANVLYGVRLGHVLGDLEHVDGAYIRRFEHGVVVANPAGQKKRVSIKLGGMPKLSDVYDQRIVQVTGNALVVDIPGQAGRVFSEVTA